MSVIEKKASALCESVSDDVPDHALPEGWWVRLVEMAVQMLLDCQKKPEEVPALAKKPGLRGRARLRLLVHHALQDEDAPETTKSAVVNSLLEQGKESTTGEVKKMFSEVKKVKT